MNCPECGCYLYDDLEVGAGVCFDCGDH